MGCGSCSSGGCSTKSGSKSSGGCSGCEGGSCNVLSSSDWLGDIFDWVNESYRSLAEIRFKGGRKEFLINKTNKRLYTGDAVMVETGAGYHLGFVSLQGEMAHLQLKKKTPKTAMAELKGIVRIASDKDFERYEEARSREMGSLFRTRQIVHEMKMPMKLSDVEFQADGSKATFYYSSEDRVDFRDLIKQLAGEFKVRVDMRQISLRQEAGRIGGIGTCGRELCCSTWLTDFKGVSTSAARYQNLSLNPTKLSGQCGRLKCCLNYELDTYLQELKDIPKVERDLQTLKGYARLQKTDIFRKLMWFAYSGDESNWVKIDIARVNYILEQNKAGNKPVALTEDEEVLLVQHENEVKNEDLIELDRKYRKVGTSKKKKKKPRPQGAEGQSSGNPGPVSGNSAPNSGARPQNARPQGQAQGQNRGPKQPNTPGDPQSQRPQNSNQQGRGQRPQNRPGEPRPPRPDNQDSRPPRPPGNKPSPPKEGE